jgi:1,4-dihydroxy-2-naphthoate octaprenyltransferase
VSEPADGPPTEAERRAIARRRAREVALVLALLVVGGIVIVVTGASVAGVAVGSGIMGVGGVVAVSAVFYEVGAGEDRERARRPPS